MVCAVSGLGGLDFVVDSKCTKFYHKHLQSDVCQVYD